jgi:hypothetical protein
VTSLHGVQSGLIFDKTHNAITSKPNTITALDVGADMRLFHYAKLVQWI